MSVRVRIPTPLRAATDGVHVTATVVSARTIEARLMVRFMTLLRW